VVRVQLRLLLQTLHLQQALLLVLLRLQMLQHLLLLPFRPLLMKVEFLRALLPKKWQKSVASI
jgi:hypothetical protein